MTLGSILLSVALLLLVGVFVLRPILVRKRSGAAEPSLLAIQKDHLVKQIRLLDLDYETGKLPEEQYAPQREKLLREAATLLRQIDLAQDEHDVDAQIEAAVQTLRNTLE